MDEHAELVLLRATVMKLRAERRIMHEMLTRVGVRADVLGDGVRTCLIGRLAIAIDLPSEGNPSDTKCRCPEAAPHQPGCAYWK